jgi:hypothetical protein
MLMSGGSLVRCLLTQASLCWLLFRFMKVSCDNRCWTTLVVFTCVVQNPNRLPYVLWKGTCCFGDGVWALLVGWSISGLECVLLGWWLVLSGWYNKSLNIAFKHSCHIVCKGVQLFLDRFVFSFGCFTVSAFKDWYVCCLVYYCKQVT